MFRTRPVLLDRGQSAVRVNMTGARAIAQLTDGVPDVGVFVLLVRPCFVVAGMTTRAFGLKRRKLPGNEFGIVLVASRARQVATVILRFIGQRDMAVIRRGPRVSAMACIAFLGGTEVVRVLTRSLDAIVAG